MTHAGVALINPYTIFEHAGLAAGMRVADFGCGRTGHFVFPASRQVGERGVVYAVDVMKDVLHNIQSRMKSEGYHNVQTVWSNIELRGRTAIPEASLDGGFFVNVLSLLHDQAGGLGEAARLLKEKGFLAIVEWAKNIGPLGPHSGMLVAPDTAKELAARSGLQLHDELPAGDYHYCLIFTKA